MPTKDEREKEYIALGSLVSDFSVAMRAKLFSKYEEGKRGWNDDSDTEVIDMLRRSLAVHILKYNNGEDPSQLVDIGNYIAMLWNLECRGK
jgi:hypothetical protein